MSVGIARWDGESPRPTPTQLLGLADEALYEAKRAGRDRVRLSDVPCEKPKRSSQSGESRINLVTGNAH